MVAGRAHHQCGHIVAITIRALVGRHAPGAGFNRTRPRIRGVQSRGIMLMPHEHDVSPARVQDALHDREVSGIVPHALVRERNDPRSACAIHSQNIRLQPSVLICDILCAARVEPQLAADHDVMHARAGIVHAVPLISARARGHACGVRHAREPPHERFKAAQGDARSSRGPGAGALVVAHTENERLLRNHGLDRAKESVAHASKTRGQIVGEVPSQRYVVVQPACAIVYQAREGQGVREADVSQARQDSQRGGGG